jgi:glycosyltransferase involved in cell wall biosynthesis
VSRTFTVVVPTRDRPGDLSACLRSVLAADNGQLREIIVIDDGSAEPARPESAGGQVAVRLIRHVVPVGPDRSRNEAASVARADDLVFLDDDARMAHDWFAVASATAGSGARSFTGRVLPFDGGLLSQARQWRYDQRYAALATGQRVGFFAGGNSVADRELFLRAGGFPMLSAGGDNGIVGRLELLGIRTQFVRELRVLHRNGKGLRVAAGRAWMAGRDGPPSGPPEIAGDCARSLSQLRGAPLDVAAVNGALQLLNTAGRLMGSLGSQIRGGTT